MSAEPQGQTPKLTVTLIRIGSTLKFFELERGVSTGTEVSMEYKVAPGEDPAAIRKAMITEKEKLDKLALATELARGAISHETYAAHLKRIKEGYDLILKRTPGGEDKPREG